MTNQDFILFGVVPILIIALACCPAWSRFYDEEQQRKRKRKRGD